MPQQQQRQRQGFPWNAEPPVPVLSPRSVAVQGDELAGKTHTALGRAPKINPGSAGCLGEMGLVQPCPGTSPVPQPKGDPRMVLWDKTLP